MNYFYVVRRDDGSVKAVGAGRGRSWAGGGKVEVHEGRLDDENAQAMVALIAPDPPTPEQVERNALRDWARAQIQSAVGVRAPDLTAAQVKALLLALLVQAGAIDRDGYVRPPQEWL